MLHPVRLILWAAPIAVLIAFLAHQRCSPETNDRLRRAVFALFCCLLAFLVLDGLFFWYCMVYQSQNYMGMLPLIVGILFLGPAAIVGLFWISLKAAQLLRKTPAP